MMNRLPALLSLNSSLRRYTTARVWDIFTRREVAKLEGHTDAVRSCAYSPGMDS
jgi:WD40 repeat protein